MATPNLDKVLLQADADSAHEDLLGECPWYRQVVSGEPAAGPGEHCGGGALVKLTPRTAEASTVVQPTVPPGGPGLFHMKGHHLPPYVEHLYKHLVGRYGKHEAYRVAVGVVKKWAQGINPGGWKTKSGKGKRTHPDVQAAAQRNVEEWEKEKAEAHARSAAHGKGKAGHTLAASAVSAPPLHPVEGGEFPGDEMVPLPPVPHDNVSRSMFTAHRIDGLIHNLTHASERFAAAVKEQDPALRGYHVIHLGNHLSRSLDAGHLMADNLRRNYPAEGSELDALTRTIGLAKALSPAAKAATLAHLLETVLYNAGHAKRHAEGMARLSPAPLWQFNADHCGKHLKHALEHSQKLAEHVRDNYPAERRFLERLPVGSPPYEARLARVGAATAPGAAPVTSQYGLHQSPAATVAPSPPLPPKVAVPRPGEVRAIAARVPDSAQADLSSTVRHFLETAAVKLEKDDELAALAMLRSAAAAILSAHKADQGKALPAARTAAVFTPVPGAAQSSATAAMKETAGRAQEWRKLDLAVQALADRIRKRYFHGVYSGPSTQARLSASLLPAQEGK